MEPDIVRKKPTGAPGKPGSPSDKNPGGPRKTPVAPTI